MTTTKERIRATAATRAAGLTWPTLAELRDAMTLVEKAGTALDELDVRLSGVVRNEDRPTATLEDVGALAQFIEMCEMDIFSDEGRGRSRTRRPAFGFGRGVRGEPCPLTSERRTSWACISTASREAATMPAEARGHARKLPSGKWQLRWYDRQGGRRSGGAFPTRSEALRHYRDVIEPELNGRVAVRKDVTLRELADVFLDRHAKIAQPRTLRALRERLRRPLEDFGDVPLVEFERMTDELAGFAAKLPDRYRYSIMSALRQTCEAGVHYGYMTQNPAKLAGSNPQPPPRAVRVFTRQELEQIAKELDTRGAAAVRFAAATGLRPSEWASLERRDVDCTRRVISVRGTKTARSRREVPLMREASAALDSLPPRLDSPYVFAGPKRGPFDVANFRRREWGPAIESAGIAKPARIYDLRSTFISNALAHGLTVFETARIAGTSVAMIEAHYGALLDTAHESLLERLEQAATTAVATPTA